jgi:hypothetical protein
MCCVEVTVERRMVGEVAVPRSHSLITGLGFRAFSESLLGQINTECTLRNLRFPSARLKSVGSEKYPSFRESASVRGVHKGLWRESGSKYILLSIISLVWVLYWFRASYKFHWDAWSAWW